jgi:hypothetical protein
VTTFTTVNTQAAVTSGTPGGDFTVSVPNGWTKFVEQRGQQGVLPDSTTVRWISSTGQDELAVERFAGWDPRTTQQYTDALKKADPAGRLFFDPNAPDEFLFRTYETGRSMYIKVVTVDGDLWVLSVTVPTISEDSGKAALYDKIGPTFQVTS